MLKSIILRKLRNSEFIQFFSNFFSILLKHRPAEIGIQEQLTPVVEDLEKIKTIGDAYMCAGGLPTENKTHPENAYAAAQEILEFVRDTKNNTPKGIYPFEVRIGLNTGPVVAGVVGTKKFQYDIWGNTVNIAARMESNSEPGKINVSENTYHHLKDRHHFTYRGVIEAKNKQLLKMYYAEKKLVI